VLLVLAGVGPGGRHLLAREGALLRACSGDELPQYFVCLT
jgi:hypothetical protein